MNLDRLYEILRASTVQLPKEVLLIRNQHGAAINVHRMPPADDPGLEKIDLEFLVIGVDKTEAEKHKAELISILKTYPQPDRLADGPSYIEVAGEIGDQGATFQLFALGQVLGLWKVITPASVGFSGADANEMACRGFIMITGFKEV